MVLLVGVALSASLFVLVGFVAVARFDSINEYFLGAVGWGTVLFLPLFGFVGVVETRLFYLLPTQPTLVLVAGGFEPLATWEIAYGIGYLLVANAVAYAWARRTFRRYIVRGGDPGRQFGRDDVPGSRQRRDRTRLAPRSPALGLVFATLASNTIEGLAISKLVNIFVLGPAVVIAVVPEPLGFVAGVVPTYWPVKAFVAGTSGEPSWSLFLFVGIVAHLLALAWLGQRFARRID